LLHNADEADWSRCHGARPTLIESLNESSQIVCEKSAAAVGGIGPDAKTAPPAVTDLLNNQNHPVAEGAPEAIRKIEKP